MALRSPKLRLKMLVAVLAAVVLPQVLVIASGTFDRGVDERMQRNVAAALEEARARLGEAGQRSDREVVLALLDAVADDHGVRLRWLDARGETQLDLDHDGPSGLYWAASRFFFGPDGAPSLGEFDATLGPLLQRPELVAAAGEGVTATACRHSPGGLLLVCHAAGALPAIGAGGGEGSSLLYVQESSRRAIRSLYDARYQMLKLLVFVLPFAVLIALWLIASVIGPVERLEREVAEQAKHPRRDLALRVDGRDEVGELAAAFNGLLDELARQRRSNEAFVADLVHEFKNPVAAIRAAAERVARAKPSDAEQLERLGKLLGESSGRLDRLVSAFLELARAEAGLSREPREPVDLVALVRALVQRFAADSRYAAVSFPLEAPEHPVDVVASPGRLEVALGNLLENAASFVAAGGTVSVTVVHEGARAQVTVRDNGPGIAPGDLPRVFERFFTTRGGERGTGLGLALAKAIIEAHQGTLTVASKPGQGAAFTLELPVVPSSIR
jgi:two-component system sensor histidine kinase ChvG